VAERIAGRLGRLGVPADARPLTALGDSARYGAVVFGSPVYGQHWPADADRVLDRLAGEATRPLWVFSVGTFGDTRRPLGRLARREPHGIGERLASTRARGYRVFAGVVDPREWPRPSLWLFRALGGRFGDRRDWAAIDAWADAIGRELAPAGARPRPVAGAPAPARFTTGSPSP
jgi:menaquinone-dependent protoporphyrinogen oxidase